MNIGRVVSFFSMLMVVSFFAGCSLIQENSVNEQSVLEEYVIDQSDYVNGKQLIEPLQISDLSEQERAGLIQMREEEKLARDVYLTLGETWGMNIFSNIARSEQTHTDAVLAVLERYSIEDPVVNNTEIGLFASSEMTALYTELIEQGNQSLLNALIVGATVEDLDIYDLQKLMDQTENEDILATYANLQKGSRNHLRAFYRQIKNNGGEYQARYISQEQLEAIVSSDQERGKVQ